MAIKIESFTKADDYNKALKVLNANQIKANNSEGMEDWRETQNSK